MSIEVMRQALEELEADDSKLWPREKRTNAITTLRAAITEAEKQEPVAWMSPGKERLEFSRPDTVYGSHTIPLYKHPVASQFSVGVIDSDGYLYPDHPLEPGTVLYTTPQPAIPDGWVSVNERLPDHRNECLVYSRHIEDGCVVKQSHLNPAKTGFYVEYSDDGETPLEEITHWMPLPAAPKPEEMK